ncbi:DNA internalization-related competence protein ComEC/Rec2 [Pseudoalteromonas aliena]|uniref:DNA internalization-related competence protein ComEC/Rec2 n=1 Tax=Pseudoalteromonas aliena TaxID=247523 RepID=UPI002494FA3B|nr:DNA internalization-related competence protein ComEC/Rec2 [Pseudoalteromonas aliena]
MNRFFSHLKQPFTSVWISLGFVIGCIATVFYYQTLEFTVLTISIVIVSVYFKPFLNVLLGFICAICCIAVHFYTFYNFEIPKADEKYAHSAELIIESIISSKQPQYIKAKIIKLNDDSYAHFRAPSAMLSVNSSQTLLIGNTFSAVINLKPFRSTKNFHVFDNEHYAFTQRIFFKGKVLNKELVITNNEKQSAVINYRKFVKAVYSNTTLQWLYYALLTGDKSLMDFSDKQLMQSLGLSHLLAISGLHIGLIFGFGYLFTRSLLKHIKYVSDQTKNLSVIYSTVGFFAAFIYVYLSDFLVSATRALIMLGCYLLLYYLAKQPLRWRSILFALVILLIINPFNVLNAGLYFSFTAVAIIFLVVRKIPILNTFFLYKIASLGLVQLALFLGLLPLSLYFFHGVSLAGLVLNLIAIPLLSLIVMPSLIIITLVSSVFDMGISITFFDGCLSYLFQLLTKIPVFIRWLNIGNTDSIFVVFYYITFLIFYLVPYKWLACIPFSVLLFNYLVAEKPKWQLHVFDVGHGLMVLIEKDKQALIYDFGPSYFNRFSRARSILLPYIEANKLLVSIAVLSHEDSDHAGGVEHFMQAGYESTFATFHPHNLQDICKVAKSDFFGLKIESFKTTNFQNENDDSCVIRVSDKAHSVLLTGDISKQREAQLLQQGYFLKSTVMLSPHHGSDTSSSDAFIKAVHPQIVIHSSAYKGQWQFPKLQVVKRYSKINATQYVTGQQGQISVKFYNDYAQVKTAREYESYWFIKD